jgi:hypothetical protein
LRWQQNISVRQQSTRDIASQRISLPGTVRTSRAPKNVCFEGRHAACGYASPLKMAKLPKREKRTWVIEEYMGHKWVIRKTYRSDQLSQFYLIGCVA